MKVIVTVNNYAPASLDEEKAWYVLADSAVTNTGKPFYLPEKEGEVAVSLGAAVKISRLGKYISPRFAKRYYCEFAPAVHFRMTGLEKKLISAGLPGDSARNFDKSLFVGDFEEIDNEAVIELRLNGEKAAEFSLSRLLFPLEEIVAKVSELNTLKMGDLMLPGLSGEIRLKKDDFLEVSIRGSKAFIIRVK